MYDVIVPREVAELFEVPSTRRDGGIARHAGLKNLWAQAHEGWTPSPGTREQLTTYYRQLTRGMEEFIKAIIKEAGAVILEKFRKVGVKYTKENPGDVVTEADLASNELLIQRIKEKYPTHGIISEETGEENASAEYVWYIDPLDGTRNYATHTPLFGVMIAVRHGSELEYAAVYDPVHQELACAQRGKGAFLNGKRSECSHVQKVHYSFGSSAALMNEKSYGYKRALLEAAREGAFHINEFGSAAVGILYMVDGRRDWTISRGAKAWDYAPAALILREAGCVVTNMQGNSWTLGDESLIAANPVLHKQLIEIVNKKYSMPG